MRIHFATNSKTRGGLFLVTLFLLLFGVFIPVYAQSVDLGVNAAAPIGLSTVSFPILVARIIRVFFGLIGTIFVVLVIYAGWRIMASEGNADEIEDGKNTLKNAAIGLAIMLSAVAIVTFIINVLTTSPRFNQQTYEHSEEPLIGALSGGAIQGVYPLPNQIDVPRNTFIMVTFRDVIDPTTIINNYKTKDDPTNNIWQDDLIKTDAVALTDGTVDDAGKFTVQGAVWPNVYVKTADNRTFVFMPVEVSGGKIVVMDDGKTPKRAYLGSASDKMWYQVSLSSAIKKPNKDTALLGGYNWKFETSTTIDVTPPTVKKFMPAGMKEGVPETTEYGRNIVAMVTFSEAVNPINILQDDPALYAWIDADQNKSYPTEDINGNGVLDSGEDKNGDGLLTHGVSEDVNGNGVFDAGEDTNVSGVLDIDQKLTGTVVKDDEGVEKLLSSATIVPPYKIAEVRGHECGTNTCGETIYCFPANQIIKITAETATLSADAPMAEFNAETGWFDGIVDMCGNALDGSGEGTMAGKPLNEPTKADNYFNEFSVSDLIERSSPVITSLSPAKQTPQIGEDEATRTNPFSAVFSMAMLPSSFVIGEVDPATSPSDFVDKENSTFGLLVDVGKDGSKTNDIIGCSQDFCLPLTWYLSFEGQGGREVLLKHSGLYNLAAVNNSLKAQKPSLPAVTSVRYLPLISSKVKDQYQNCFMPPSDSIK